MIKALVYSSTSSFFHQWLESLKKEKNKAEVSDAFHIFEGNKNGTRVGSLKQPEPFSPFSIHEPLFSELLSFWK